MTGRLHTFRLVVAGCGVALISAAPLAAQQSSLTQSVDPIVCQYVKVSDGTTTTTSTECDEQTIPKLETVKVFNRQIRLSGYYAASSTKSLRLWIGGNWFSLNSYQGLTVNGDTWQLEIDNIELFAAGSYDIVVETITEDGYLLRTLYEDALKVPRVNIIKTETDYGGGTSRNWVSQTQGGAVSGQQAFTLMPNTFRYDADEFPAMLEGEVITPPQLARVHSSKPTSSTWIKASFITICLAALFYWVKVYSRQGKATK